jgi:hypothetical protein
MIFDFVFSDFTLKNAASMPALFVPYPYRSIDETANNKSARTP